MVMNEEEEVPDMDHEADLLVFRNSRNLDALKPCQLDRFGDQIPHHSCDHCEHKCSECGLNYQQCYCDT